MDSIKSTPATYVSIVSIFAPNFYEIIYINTVNLNIYAMYVVIVFFTLRCSIKFSFDFPLCILKVVNVIIRTGEIRYMTILLEFVLSFQIGKCCSTCFKTYR